MQLNIPKLGTAMYRISSGCDAGNAMDASSLLSMAL